MTRPPSADIRIVAHPCFMPGIAIGIRWNTLGVGHLECLETRLRVGELLAPSRLPQIADFLATHVPPLMGLAHLRVRWQAWHEA